MIFVGKTVGKTLIFIYKTITRVHCESMFFSNICIDANLPQKVTQPPVITHRYIKSSIKLDQGQSMSQYAMLPTFVGKLLANLRIFFCQNFIHLYIP